MKITTTGRKIDITEGLRGYVEKKISKLEKYFQDGATSQVTLSVQKDYHTVEVTIFQGGMIFRSEITDRDMYAAIDKSVDVLERQIRKQKTKLSKRVKSAVFDPIPDFLDITEEDDGEFKVVKTKSFSMKPLSVQEAILQMNMVGHKFYMFQNEATGQTNVVYERRNGEYGLIEPE